MDLLGGAPPLTYQRYNASLAPEEVGQLKQAIGSVNNEGDVYTVDRDTFARTYRAESPGLYRKVTPCGPRWPIATVQSGRTGSLVRTNKGGAKLDLSYDLEWCVHRAREKKGG